MAINSKNESEGLLKGVMLGYLILILHVLLIVMLGFLVLFFRKLKREGRTLKETLRSSTFQGRPVEISLMGGMASLKVGSPREVPAIDAPTADPSRQLEDPAALKVRELSELARLLENDLITQDEFELAKSQLLNVHTISNANR